MPPPTPDPTPTPAPVPVPADFAAVLVDLDGTLVNSEAPVRRAWSAFARRHGLDVAAVLRAAQGRPSRETAAQLSPDAATGAAEARTLEHAELTDTDGLIALPGAAALLAAPLRLAIVTSCSAALLAVRLRAAGLPAPAVTVTADDVSAGKPDPEPFLIGARRCDADPARCLVLEDSPAGIASGAAAGATVVAVRTTHADAELVAAGADAVVDDLAALTLPA